MAFGTGSVAPAVVRIARVEIWMKCRPCAMYCDNMLCCLIGTDFLGPVPNIEALVVEVVRVSMFKSLLQDIMSLALKILKKNKQDYKRIKRIHVYIYILYIRKAVSWT